MTPMPMAATIVEGVLKREKLDIKQKREYLKAIDDVNNTIYGYMLCYVNSIFM